MIRACRHIALLALLLVSSAAHAQTAGVQYVPAPAGLRILTGAQYASAGAVTVSWDAVENATHYEVQAVWIDPSQAFAYTPVTTTACELEVARPRTGHFMVRVRACNDAGCSDWAESTNPQYATVGGQACGWWVFFRLPPVSDITVDDPDDPIP